MKRKTIVYIIILLIVILLYILYSNKLIEGYDTMNNYSVIFAGTVRNVEKYIKQNLKNIDKCGEKFKKYAVIIYENDSTDNTRKILNDNKKDNYYYIFENNIKEPKRTVRLSNGRNKILNKVKEINKNNIYNFLIMLDLDDVNSSGKFINTIDSCFKTDNWDVLTGNQSDTYYDIWAFRKKGLLDWDCWKEYRKAVASGMDSDEAKQKYVFGILDVFDKDQLIEVDSAFSGIAIYNLRTISDQCKYHGLHEDGDELCEHVPFHKCIKENGGKIFINTNFLTN